MTTTTADTNTNSAAPAGGSSSAGPVATLPVEAVGKAQALGFDETQMPAFANLWAVLTPAQRAALRAQKETSQAQGTGEGEDERDGDDGTSSITSSPKKRWVNDDDDLRAAVAALAADGKVKFNASKGKKALIGVGMTADERAAYLNTTTIFGAYDVPPHLVTRLHARDQLIPLFYLTNEALAAAAIPSSEIFKKISNLNVPLDGSLDATLKTGDLHKTLKRFIELWCMEQDDGSLDEDELEALDEARRAWLGHLKIVDDLVESAEDAFEERVALAYDMEIRAAAHKIKNRRFDPSIVWDQLKQRARDRVQREEYDPSRVPSIFRRLHPDAAALLPDYAPAPAATPRGGGRAFRPNDFVPSIVFGASPGPSAAAPKFGGAAAGDRKKSADSPRRSADTYFGCGGSGHGVGICASKGKIRAAMRGRELRAGLLSPSGLLSP
ncbi:hypothetical protein JCM5296_003560 [Sporobolomyces johnsonii]